VSKGRPTGLIAAHNSPKPLGIEIAFVTPDVFPAHAAAIKAGAVELSAPKEKLWGQVVFYVRCPDGTLVELCTPIGE
jgi:lactoylglutathione lyase